MKGTIQSIISKYGFGISVEDLVRKVYWELASLGFRPCIVNDRYIECDGITYQLRKTRTKGQWTAVEI